MFASSIERLPQKKREQTPPLQMQFSTGLIIAPDKEKSRKTLQKLGEKLWGTTGDLMLCIE
jgi:hypothetical protein